MFLLLAPRAHLPAKVAGIAFDRVPLQYIKNATASSVASKLVYKEGTQFVQSLFLSPNSLTATALNYLVKEKEIRLLQNILVEANMPESEKHKILELLEAGGARTLLTAKGLNIQRRNRFEKRKRISN